MANIQGLGEFSVGAFLCVVTSSRAMEATEMAAELWHLWETESGLEERGVGNFRNLTRTCIPSMSAGAHRVRRWTSGRRTCQTRTPSSSPLSVVHVSFQMLFHWSAGRTAGSQWRLCSSPHLGSQVTLIPVGHLIANSYRWWMPFPGVRGLRVLSSTALWSTMRVRAVTVSCNLRSFMAWMGNLCSAKGYWDIYNIICQPYKIINLKKLAC